MHRIQPKCSLNVHFYWFRQWLVNWVFVDFLSGLLAKNFFDKNRQHCKSNISNNGFLFLIESMLKLIEKVDFSGKTFQKPFKVAFSLVFSMLEWSHLHFKPFQFQTISKFSSQNEFICNWFIACENAIKFTWACVAHTHNQLSLANAI